MMFVVSALCEALALAQPRYEIVQITPPADSGAYGIGASGINNRGDVVGEYSAPLPDGRNHIGGFLYTDATGTVDVHIPGKRSTAVTGINDRGQLAISTSEDNGHWRVMYRYTPGVGMEQLPTLGGDESETSGINASGEITGYSETPDGRNRVFRYTDRSGIESLSGSAGGVGYAINDCGWVAAVNGGAAMLLREEGNLNFGPGSVRGLNNAGDVVGHTFIVPGHPTAFVYRNGEMLILGDDVFSDPVLLDINESGHAVGGGFFVDEFFRVREAALFWSEETGLVDLNTFLAENSGWELWIANGINDSGQIIGFGSGGAFRLDPILDPAAALARCIKLLEDSSLPRKCKQPMLISLKSAAASLERGSLEAVVGQLSAFQNKVRAQISDDDPALASALIKCAQQTMDAISRTPNPNPIRPGKVRPSAITGRRLYHSEIVTTTWTRSQNHLRGR